MFVKCYGSNSNHILDIPLAISNKVNSIQAGGTFTCMILGGVFSCHGTKKGKLLTLDSFDQYDQISAGITHVCGMKRYHNVKCYSFSQSDDWLVPDIPNVNLMQMHYSFIVTGYKFSCMAVIKPTQIYCWGRNDHGQFSAATVDGTYELSSVKFPLLAAGVGHVCVSGVGAHHFVKC